MRVAFDDDELDRLETDPSFTMGLANSLVRAYRMRLQQIRSTKDERDFYALKSLHYERLRGDRQGLHSMRLNKQFRLILGISGTAPDKEVRIVGIEDYH